MKVLYDGFIFRAQKVGGINRYFENLVAHMPDELEPHLTVVKSQSAIFPRHPRLAVHRVPTWMNNLTHGGGLLTRTCLRGFELAAGCNLRHPTFYETLSSQPPKRSRRTPMVLTVHDAIDEIFASQLDPHGERVGFKRAAIEAADAILCVSESTKHDLQARYRIPDARIAVTHLATSLTAPSPASTGEVPRKPYVIFVGNRNVYKNFVRVLLAVAEARRAWSDLSLCVCGESFNYTEWELIQVLKLSKAVENLGFVDDARLAELYQASEALLYPSLYEGFGIPPLEAMACGTVVITSNRSSLPEVVGEAALLVNPDSSEEIVEAILRLRELGGERETLINAGKARAAQFSWARTSQQTLDVYRALAA